jgi:hypothetical protein
MAPPRNPSPGGGLRSAIQVHFNPNFKSYWRSWQQDDDSHTRCGTHRRREKTRREDGAFQRGKILNKKKYQKRQKDGGGRSGKMTLSLETRKCKISCSESWQLKHPLHLFQLLHPLLQQLIHRRPDFRNVKSNQKESPRDPGMDSVSGKH